MLMRNFLIKTSGFFKKIWLWIKNHAPTRRRIIQLYVALLTNANIKGLFTGMIYTGGTKNVCVPGLNCYSCPSTVAACPLGALQNALAGSGTRTPIYILGILALLGIMLGRVICGFLCPTGLIQDLLYKIKTPKLKKNKITRILSYFKYVLLVGLVVAIPLAYMLQNTPVPAFCKYICPSGTLGGAILLLINPVNADMFGMLGGLFTWKFAVLVVILVASVFIYRPFCRFVCPLGAIYGFFNKIALLGVKVEKDRCTDCGLCVAHCKMDIKHVGDHECINCGECIKVCPTKAIVWKGSSIFVKPNDIENDLAVKVPLTNFVQPVAAGAVGEGDNVVLSQAAETRTTVAATADASAAPMRKIYHKRPYIGPKGQQILKIVTVVFASLLLVGAIVYYNFFDVSATERVMENNQVGDVCADFSVEMYGSHDGEIFTLSENRGKVTVINFWYTSCTPCVLELPYFEEVAAKYADEVTIVALHSTSFRSENVNSYLDRVGWTDWTVMFAQDVEQDFERYNESGEIVGSETMSVYQMLGGNQAYPMTIIVDAEGVITFKTMGETSLEELENAVLEALE